ncbi:MAG: 3-hydroxyacyl-CoA dehydrogenase [Spirochaetes bacterium]|jgi:3-hydroxybutyryl-CoA dehydrogenase|nr:3-hydroxyacyl-CoA dehydrogenase [Spirochaetota bacterium]
MNIEDIKKVLIIGSGTMGQQIGAVCAVHGLDVVLYDVSADALKNGAARTEKLVPKLAQIYGRDPKSAGRIIPTTDPNEASDVDFVSESVPEDPSLKEKIFTQFNGICPGRAIFTTNTSSLLPSMIADKTGRPDRFAALHFHDVRVTRIVDVMPHKGTSPEITETVSGFARRIGQIPVRLNKENHGYIFNAMFMNLLASALTLWTRDVASIQDIDRSWMGVMHTPIGPFGLMDQIGIDTVHKLTEYWAKKTDNRQGMANAEKLKPYVTGGKLGAKTGEGFYKYPGPEYSAKSFVEGS